MVLAVRAAIMINQFKSNKWSIWALLSAFTAGGLLVWLGFVLLSSDAKQAAEKKPLYWVAPMDASYKRDQPGKSPMGMDLIPVYAETAQGSDDASGTVRISPAVAHNLGVRIATVTERSLNLDISTVGYISFDEKRLTHFHSRVDGWIEKLAVTAVGDPVIKGQVLFELYSPKLVSAGEEYLTVLDSGNRLLIDASVSKLNALGVEPMQIETMRTTRKVPQRLAFYADKDGYIAALSVREGMFIQPATTVLSLGGLDSVWVIAEIFERQASWVKAGQSVEMTVSSYPGERWRGQINYLYPLINAQTRTLRARVKFDNPAHRLKPDMFAQLIIHAGHREAVLSIPREAVIRDGKMSRVVKVVDEGRYRSMRIETGIESGDQVEVLKGLQINDRIVVSAQFLIDSESSIAADLSRIEEDPSVAIGRIRAEGVIKTLIPDQRKATIAHAPIPEWNWSAMTMDFFFSADIDLNKLTQGQHIHFELQRNAEGQYWITDIILAATSATSSPVTRDSIQSTQSPVIDHSMDEHTGQPVIQAHDHD